MAEYSDELINELAKRFAADRLDRGDKIRLGKNPKLKKIVEERGEYQRGKILAAKEASGKASRKVLEQIGRLEGHALRGYTENKGNAPEPKKSAGNPSTKLSKLVHSMMANPQATLSMMSEVIRRDITLVEFAARLEVAPATLTKVLAMANLSFESFRDASLPNALPLIATMMSSMALCADQFANVGDEGISAEQARRISIILGSAQAEVKKLLSSRYPSAPAGDVTSDTDAAAVRAATPSVDGPKSAEQWREYLSSVDLSRLSGYTLDLKARALASEFIAWSISLRSEGDEHKDIVAKPWNALLGFNDETKQHPMMVSKQLLRFVALVIELVVQSAPEPEWDGNSLLQTLVWLIENGAEGSARALTAACYLARSPAISTYSRNIRSQVITSIREDKLKIPDREYSDLIAGADRNAV
jgi:hypothetical protein